MGNQTRSAMHISALILLLLLKERKMMSKPLDQNNKEESEVQRERERVESGEIRWCEN